MGATASNKSLKVFFRCHSSGWLGQCLHFCSSSSPSSQLYLLFFVLYLSYSALVSLTRFSFQVKPVCLVSMPFCDVYIHEFSCSATTSASALIKNQGAFGRSRRIVTTVTFSNTEFNFFSLTILNTNFSSCLYFFGQKN